eukprot:363206-Chlamydomonas_euryale.AAC.2
MNVLLKYFSAALASASDLKPMKAICRDWPSLQHVQRGRGARSPPAQRWRRLKKIRGCCCWHMQGDMFDGVWRSKAGRRRLKSAAADTSRG